MCVYIYIYIFLFSPGYALHEKGLQRQISVGTLASSQERRALLVPRINRWSTAGFVPPSVYIRFPLFVLPKSPPQHLPLVRQSVRGTVLSWANRSVGVPFRSALPSPPLRRARSPDPPVVCPGFGFDSYIMP